MGNWTRKIILIYILQYQKIAYAFKIINHYLDQR